MKNLFAFCLLFPLVAHSTSAQERLGLKIDNYAGVNGLYLNPASGTHLPYSWDLNIVSAEQFADNNYGFIRNANLGRVLRNTDNIVVATGLGNESDIPAGALIADYKTGENRYYAQNNTQVMGPSFLYNLNNEHSFGLMTAFRAVGGTRSLPGILGYREFDAEEINDEFLVKPFKMAGAAWSEIALNYGYNTGENLSFGVNAKYLMGYEGAYFNSYNETGLTKQNGNEIDFQAGDAEFGVTTTYLENQEFTGIKKNGGGFSLDLGMNYTIKRGYDDGYLVKLGVSLLDLGYLRFNNNAEVHRFDNITPYSLDLDAYQSLTEYQDFLELANNDVYSADESLQGNNFSIALPTALSIQADYAVTNSFFVNGTIVQHIPLGQNRLARTDILAITPRFERRWFGAMLPISILNYDQVHVGLSLRLGWITIGSENLGSLVGQSNFTGSDLYFALKVNPIQLRKRERNRRPRNKKNRGGWKPVDKRGVSKRGRGRVKCYF